MFSVVRKGRKWKEGKEGRNGMKRRSVGRVHVKGTNQGPWISAFAGAPAIFDILPGDEKQTKDERRPERDQKTLVFLWHSLCLLSVPLPILLVLCLFHT